MLKNVLDFVENLNKC